MKALVTGGSGFIGSALVARLISGRHRTVVLTRKPEAMKRLRDKNLTVYGGDLSNRNSLKGLPDDFDYVFHLAAERDSVGNQRCYGTNVLGTRHLIQTILEKKMKLKKFIHVSSLGAAGFSKDQRAKNEQDPMEPISFYGKTKMEAENEVTNHDGAFPYMILRPCKVYGPGDKRILLHFKFVKYGLVPNLQLDERLMSLCYRDDFVEVMLMAAIAPHANRTYFISDGNIYTWKVFYEAIAHALNKKMRTIFVPERMIISLLPFLRLLSRLPQRLIPLEPTTLHEIRSKSWSCDPSRFFSDFNYTPATDLETGLKRSATWFQENHLI